MTQFISHIHEEIRRARVTRRGATQEASDTPQGVHKVYPRMTHVALPSPQELDMSLTQSLNTRSSTTLAGDVMPLSLTDFGSLFGHALMKRKNSARRNYPSGGALYPIETYLFSFSIEGTRPGIFHYNPTTHSLERLWDIPSNITVKDLIKRPDWLFPSNLIVFTAVWKRSSAKYGDLAYSHALLEAGHMSENILLTATALHLESRPVAGFNDARIVELLDLVPEDELPVHAITIAKGSRGAPNEGVVVE